MMKTVVALIPLRAGSKSVKDKNIKPIAGKPLCSWAIEAALGCSKIDSVWVSTDSVAYQELIASMHPEVQFCQRSEETSTDMASTESVMLEFSEQVPFDLLVTLQATSPLTTSDQLAEACDLFAKENADSLVTGVLQKRFYWSPEGKALNYDPQSRPLRQDFAGNIVENGAFYMTKRSLLKSQKCRLGGKIAVYTMPEESFVELDEPSDVELIENLLRRHRASKGIALLVCDSDGTLTDAGMYYDAQGDALRKFNTRDAKGLSLVREAGIEVAIISTENAKITQARARKLGIKHCYVGVENKESTLNRLMSELNITFEQVAYIGDDVNDAECMKKVGLAACPADAVKALKLISTYICRERGGHGAVREFCDYLLER